MPKAPSVHALEAELVHVREHFSSLSAAAESCCQGAIKAAEIATKLESASFSEPKLRARVENLRSAAQALKGFERNLRSQIQELSKPLQHLETLSFNH